VFEGLGGGGDGGNVFFLFCGSVLVFDY
jgi:hypothetical protein